MINRYRSLVDGVASAPKAHPRVWSLLLPKHTSKRTIARLVELEMSVRSRLAEPDPSTISDRVARLRRELIGQNLQGFIVPHADRFQCEYTPARDERLAWLTGFKGSAGSAVVLMESAFVTSDGRYKLKLPAQTDESVFQIGITDSTLREAANWMARNVQNGDAIGYDAWLHTPNEIDIYRRALEKVGATLRAVTENPIDRVWINQPAEPISPIVVHELQYAGVPWSTKVTNIADALKRDGIDVVILTNAASVAWLLNIRGGDVLHTPLPLAYAAISADGGVSLFCDPRKLSASLADHFGAGVQRMPMADFPQWLSALGQKKVQIDSASVACFILDRLVEAGVEVIKAVDPCLLPKACKNDIEVEGARQAHLRDGAVLTDHLYWLKTAAVTAGATEMQVAEKLDAARLKTSGCTDLSFTTIVGVGDHGADVHYQATPETDRQLVSGEVVLLDSGGQFLDGTTDVTRTVALGKPSSEVRTHATLVLKGMIALSCAQFPPGTTGHQLDVLARQFLWRAGLDFDHSTGHGVGSYLGVHEGPHGIRPRFTPGGELRPGMIVSNEPGFYKAGSHGIRIENLLVVRPERDVPGGEHGMLSFETLTWAPIDLDLVDVSLLSHSELTWLNLYHARVYQKIAPQLRAESRCWLKQATRAI